MANVGYATLPIIPSFNNFGPQLVSQLGSPMKSTGAKLGATAGGSMKSGMLSQLKGIAGPMLAIFSVGAVVAWGKANVASLARIETLNKQTATVVKATGGAANVTAQYVIDLTGSLEDLTGTEAETIQKGANFLLTFKNIRNEVGAGNDVFDQTTVAMTDMARATGQDMQGAALQLGKALNDPIKGVSALARVGVGFTDQQKEQIKTLQESGDILGAQKIVLGELQSQFGGSGQAYAETYAGKVELLGHAFGTLGETIFAGVMPALQGVAEFGMLAFRWINDNLPLVLAFGAALGIAAILIQAHGIALAISAAGGLGAWLAGTKLAAAAQWLWNAAMTANPIGIVIGLIVALVAGLVWFFTQTELGQQVWANITSFIGTAVTWLWESVLQPVFTAVGAIFTWLYQNIILPIVTGIMIYIGLWAAIFTWLWTTVVSPIFGFIGAIFTWLWQNVVMPVVNFIIGYMNLMGAGVRLLWSSYIQPAINQIGAVFNWLWTTVISPVVNFINKGIALVGSTIRTIFGGIGDFIGNAFKSALGAVRGPVNGIIGLINGAINGINRLKVTIPDWVPLVGGQTWGLNIPRIPMLARGGDVRATSGGTLAILGEAGQDETVTNLGTTNRALEATTALALRALEALRDRAAGPIRDVKLTVINPIGEPTEESIRSNAQLIGAGLSV